MPLPQRPAAPAATSKPSADNAHDGGREAQAIRHSQIVLSPEIAQTATRSAPTAPLFAAAAGDPNSHAAARRISASPALPATTGAALGAGTVRATVDAPPAPTPPMAAANAAMTSALPLPSASALTLTQSAPATSSSSASISVATVTTRAATAAPRVAPPQEATPAPLAATAAADSATNADRALMAEIQKLRAALQAQIAALSQTVAANEIQRRSPQQARVLTRLLTAGFSPQVARRIAEHTPADQAGAAIDAWMHDVLALNLKCVPEADGIVERGGIFALVGPTGVGKTTTVAKLAARFAMKYGAAQLGLITLDAYRIAAHEQLRAYGRILGTPVHLAQDSGTLRELLSGMARKRLVLIDTCGLSPRDARLAEVLDVLKQAGSPERRVAPVLLANAGSHAETIDQAARAFRAREAAGCILTKLDEATRIGGALDNALRYKLRVLGVTHGQRVPEDWRVPDSRLLAELALAPAGQFFTLEDDEGSLLANDAVAARG